MTPLREQVPTQILLRVRTPHCVPGPVQDGDVVGEVGLAPRG
jgi:hypothetical protein